MQKDVGLELLLPSLGIQLLHLSFVFATSLKLARKTYKVTPDFLVQSYLSVSLVFAGVYVCCFLMQPNERPFTIRCENVENNGCPTGESDPQFWTVVYKVRSAYAISDCRSLAHCCGAPVSLHVTGDYDFCGVRRHRSDDMVREDCSGLGDVC